LLITDNYREQNRELHRSPKFGVGGYKWASRVVNVAKNNHCESILDYGCGKGTLKKALFNWDVKEYDPAVEGKTIAEPADLVVCTDVLEHIEPELLDSVLEHLRSVTKRTLFFCISTKLAHNHVLPDGRNPHLSFHSAAWWKKKLSEKFSIYDWNEAETSCFGEALLIPELGKIISISAMDDVRRNENVRRNCAKVSRRVQDGVPPHDRTASLVCYGPSLQNTWPLLKGLQDVYCVGAAHQFLIDRGIIPRAMIDCDPRARNADQMGAPHKDVSYWLASCVDPSYVRKLAGYDLSLWHLHNGQVSADFVWSIEPEAWLLIGGGSVGLRSISLLYARGYRSFDVHAMDSSYAEGAAEGGQYAGSHADQNPKALLNVRCGDRWFKTNPSLVDYARQFMDDLRLWEGAKFRMFGDGLLQEMCRQAGMQC